MKRNQLLFSLFCILILLIVPLTSTFAQKQQRFIIQPQRPFKYDPTTKDTAVFVKNLEAPVPGGNFDKDRARALKELVSAKYPKKFTSPNKSGAGNTNAQQPSYITKNPDSLDIGTSFYANNYNFSVPSDNAMGISDSGIVVSCINSSYQFYYTDNDTSYTLGSGSLENFSENPGRSVYDPKVIYDPKQDRFIVVMLKDYSSTDTNEVVVAFSSSNNPLDEWYVYGLSGNPFNNNQWSDYPAVSITDNELFVTVNQLHDDSASWITGFQQTIVWQVDKNDGYSNQPLTTSLWSELWIDSAAGVRIRNLHPIRNYNNYISDDPSTHGAVTDQYFLSNRNFSEESDTIMLVRISGEMGSNPTMSTTLLHSDLHYFFPVNGTQKGTSWDLLTNDARVLGGTYNRNTDLIQFVQHVTDTSTGNVAIYHGQIASASTSPVCTAELISEPGFDYGYPNIASIAETANDNSTIICYNYTSNDDYPGHETRLYSETSGYTKPTRLREGLYRIYVLTNTDQRWGDYSGIQRRYNEPGTVWFEGIYGKNSGTYGNWISEIYKYEEPVASVSDAELPNAKPRMYPNPVNDKVWFNFRVPESTKVKATIFDIDGREIATVFEDHVKAGNNMLAMNTLFLQPGVYIMNVTTADGKVHLSEKFVRE